MRSGQQEKGGESKTKRATYDLKPGEGNQITTKVKTGWSKSGMNGTVVKWLRSKANGR